MDRIDGFRISEADIAKYEKKCISMKKECANEQSHGPMIGPSNEMRNIRYPIQICLEVMMTNCCCWVQMQSVQVT